MTNTKTIARNSGWYGTEQIVGLLVNLVTSIVIARTLGPSKNGYIIYLSYIVSVVANLGGFGIPATTNKYMAEFIGMGDRGTARYIYFRTLLLQIGLASVATPCIILWVLRDATADYKVAAVLIVLSIWPSMVNTVSAMANIATEDMATNLPASVISGLVYFVAIVISVVSHWGVTGIGASLLTMRVVDLLVRLVPTMMRILSWETSHALPPGLRERMLSFAWQSVASMLATMIVWERSEVILLKKFCPFSELSYYSLAFSLAERLLIGSTIFGSAVSTTIFVQFGRDKSRLPLIAATTFRYLALTAIPLHVIAVSLAVPLFMLLYGNQYAGAAMVATIAPLLCMSKAFIAPAQSLLQSHERQSFVIWATLFAGAIDIGAAWWLVQSQGAVGACIASGAAQFTAVAIMWGAGMKLYNVRLPWLFVLKVAIISALASLTAHYVAMQLPPVWGILLGGSAAIVVLFVLFYLFRVLEQEDRGRLDQLTTMMPKKMAGPAARILALLVPAESASANPASV